MYHHPASRRGGRTGHRVAPPSSSRSPAPPSSAAAKAAAAAKALHRRAQERAQEKQQEHHRMRGAQHQEDDDGRLRGGRPEPGNNDVFRRAPPANDYGGRGEGGGGGSILKRLTAGNSGRYRIGGPPPDHNDGEESGYMREKSEDPGPPKYMHGYPPYPPPGMSGGYPMPSGPYGHPPPPKFNMHNHAPPYLSSDDRKDNADRDRDRVGRNVDGEVAGGRHDDEERHSKSIPNRHPGANSKSPHPPLSGPPRPYYLEGEYVDPAAAHNYPPYGAHPHYPPGPPGHYPHPPPPDTSWNMPPPRDRENSEKSHIRRPPKKSFGHMAAVPTTPVESEDRSAAPRDAEGREQGPPPPRSTRCIIGTHTPIHVPRAAPREGPGEEPLPYRPPPGRDPGGDRGSVFRASDKDMRNDRRKGAHDEDDVDLLCERSAHKILLSLSKSFEGRLEEGRPLPRGAPPRPGGRGWDGEERPRSPDEPPRIQHWHKQSSDSFEPQPSPLKLSYSKDADGSKIDLSSSFTLFNESFDMNFEGLLGPNASFGLGPMRSLSFGLGLGAASVDHGDNPRTSPLVIQRQKSKLSSKEQEDGAAPDSPGSKRTRANVQVLRASPSSSFGNITRAGNPGSHGGDCSYVVGNSSIKVLIGGRRAGSPPAEERGRANDVGEPKSHDRGKREVDVGGEKRGPPRPHKIDQSLFGAMKRHSAVFNLFSYLLPGARTMLAGDASRDGATENDSAARSCTQPTERDGELARRRVNSALCAFGGVVLPPADSEAWPELKKFHMAQKYEASDRYYEDENRLSWEIEEDPPIEISDSDDADPGDLHSGRPGDCDEKRSHDFAPKTSLQRSIGVMVYPAVNAFTATEPGIITPALSDMNNFVGNDLLPDSTPAKLQNVTCIEINSMPPMVSPDSIRPGTNAPSSSSAPRDSITPQRSVNYAGGAWMSNHQSPRKVSPGKDPDCPSAADLLFVDTQELRPEQYRAVAQRKKKRKRPGVRYLYPALPLPYGQRKRISNAMFAMSKSIPGLTDECASVLGEARRRDAWDFAVAQLMTQVIVVTHCSVEDSRLDGLSKYLLTLGIAC